MNDPKLYLGLNDRWDDVVSNSVRISITLEGRPTASITLRRQYESLIGQRVKFEVFDEDADDYYTAFYGFIERQSVSELVSTNTTVETIIDCVDLHQICDRRIVNELWECETVTTILDDLVDDYLDLDGISFTSSGVGSTTITYLEADYITARSVLDSVAKETDAAWWITPDGELKMDTKFATAASWNITSSQDISNVKRDRTRRGFTNRQYYKYDQNIIKPASYSLGVGYHAPADGSTRSWVMPYSIVSIDSVRNANLANDEERFIKEASDTDDLTVIQSVFGEAFLQPSTSYISVVSTDSGDADDVFIYGRLNGETSVTKETLTLDGTTRVVSSYINWDYVYAVDCSDAGINGTVTVYDSDTGGSVIVTCDGGDTEGIVDLSSDPRTVETGPFYTIPYIMRSTGTGAVTAEIGIIGDDVDGNEQLGYAAIPADTTTEVALADIYRTVDYLLTGGYAATYGVDVYAPYELTYTADTPNIALTDTAFTPDNTVPYGKGYLVILYTSINTISYVDATSGMGTDVMTPTLTASLEGGTSSGVYADSSILPIDGTLTAAEALQLATNKMSESYAFTDELTYTTRKAGLAVGEYQTVTLANIGVTGGSSYTIVGVEMTDDISSENGIKWSIRLARSPAVADRMKYWRDLQDGN